MSLNYSITLLSLSFLSISTSAALAEETDPAAIPVPTPSAVAIPDEKANAAELWNRAMETFSARDFKTSAKLLQEYVDRYPSSPQALDARYHLGQSYLFGRDPEKAIPALLAVIEVRDKSLLGNEARTYLGQAYLDAEKYTEAFLVSEELLAQAGIPSTIRAKALLLRAHAQAGLKQNLEAEKTLVAYQAIADHDPELERETAASYLVSLLLKSNHCDSLPSSKTLPEDQLMDQVSRKSICVLEMGTYLAKASKHLNESALAQGADTVAASMTSLRAVCTNPPLARGNRSKAKLETARRELAEKLKEGCESAEKLVAEAFRERENLRSFQARIFPTKKKPSAKTPPVKTQHQESQR